ncbi:MAG: two-component regulator propeller domain-containing protein [Gracilimonas sp.]|nr:two-component regulator propeller domain-containing protein [Gracilimonas sp.]
MKYLVGTSTSEFPGFDPLNPFRGYSIYDGNKWENYNRLYNQELSGVETVYSVGQTSEAYYLGSWGDGVIRQSKSDNEIEVFNFTNSNLTGINSDENFVVISGLSNDSAENIWAVSYLSQYPLNVMQDGSNEWQTFGNVTGSDNYYNLFIDSNDQKWISLITNTNTGLGLLVLDTNDIGAQIDDEYVKLTENPETGNLPHPKVNAIVEDKDGEVWIGTDRGLARFIFPEFVINGSVNERQAQWLINEDTTAVSRFLLRDLNVSALAVNSANQKWVGSTNQGIWLLNVEGSKILKRFTSENSNLISNNINDIKIKEQTGEVFISTDLGLVSYQDVPKVAVNSMNSLKVYPNPFRYSDHDQILIEGLSEETSIKILGIDGFVVNSIETRGGRVNWNGRDFNGNKLGTGVYYVVASSASGGEKGIGKVVIVN